MSDIAVRRENADHRDNYIRQLQQKCRELEQEKAALHSELCTWRARASAAGVTA